LGGSKKKVPELKTPNFDRVFKGGTYFGSAYCAAPLCAPSRAAIFSGRRPTTTGFYLQIKDEDLRAEVEKRREIVLLPELLAISGYKTYGVGKIFHNGGGAGAFQEYGGKFAAYGPSPAQRMNYDPQAFQQSGTQTDWGAFPEHDSLMPDDQAAKWAIHQLKKAAKDSNPFFMTVGFIRPHVPWHVPKKWFDRINLEKVALPPYLEDDLTDIPATGLAVSAVPEMPPMHWVNQHNRWPQIIQAYLASITFVDEQIGKVLDEIERLGLSGETVVMLVSDHGYHLGEKSRFAKHALWERSLRVPMAIMGPGIERGLRIEAPVSLLDVYPTILAMSGSLWNPGAEGESLLPLLQSKGRYKFRAPVNSSYGKGNHSLMDENFHYIRYSDGSEELYDLKNDPQEWKNLATLAAVQETLERFRKSLPTQEKNYHPATVFNKNEYFQKIQKTVLENQEK